MSLALRMALPVVIVSSVLLGGCLGGDDSSQQQVSYTPLTSGQQQLVLDTYQSIALGQAAVESLNPQATPGTPGQDAESQEFEQMENILKSSIQSKACTATNNQTTDPSSGSTTDESFGVSGSDCQVSYSADQKTPVNSVSSSSSVQYAVNDATYRAMTDVDAFSESETSNLSLGSNSFNVSVQGSGSLHSQQLGLMNMTLSGGGSVDGSGNGTLQVTIQVQFPQFSAVLEEAVTENGAENGTNSSATTYTLNGVQLTQDQVSAYITPPFAPASPKPQGLLFARSAGLF